MEEASGLRIRNAELEAEVRSLRAQLEGKGVSPEAQAMSTVLHASIGSPEFRDALKLCGPALVKKLELSSFNITLPPLVVTLTHDVSASLEKLRQLEANTGLGARIIGTTTRLIDPINQFNVDKIWTKDLNEAAKSILNTASLLRSSSTSAPSTTIRRRSYISSLLYNVTGNISSPGVVAGGEISRAYSVLEDAMKESVDGLVGLISAGEGPCVYSIDLRDQKVDLYSPGNTVSEATVTEVR